MGMDTDAVDADMGTLKDNNVGVIKANKFNKVNKVGDNHDNKGNPMISIIYSYLKSIL